MASTLTARKPPPPNSSWCKLQSFCISKRCLITLIIFLALVGLLLFAMLVIVKLERDQLVEDMAFLNQDTTWRNGCDRKCRAKYSHLQI